MSLDSSGAPLVSEHDAVLLDLDGVVYRGASSVPGAVEALRAVDARLAYLTNNAYRTPAAVAAHLQSLGLPAAASDVVTSAQAIATVIAAEAPAGSAVLTIGGPGLREALVACGLTPVSDRLVPGLAAVVQGYGPDVGWRDLAEAAFAIQSGVPWYASNADPTFPTGDGIAPGNGALVQAVRLACAGREPTVAGKPHAPLFDETLRRLRPERPLMVGDRLDTDILGARRAGIASLMVLTGVHDLNDLAAAPAECRPDFVGSDLGCLHEAHPPAVVDGTTARCATEQVRLRDGVIDLGVQPTTPVIRAAVALSWARRDEFGETIRLSATIGS